MEVETQTLFSRPCSAELPFPGIYRGPNPEPSFYTSGLVIPNRIFVGRLHNKVNAEELRDIFSSFGDVKDAKIVTDHCGISKGYGFVTFQSQEDAMKVLTDDSVYVKEKKVSIGPAIYKRPASGHANSLPVAGCDPAMSQPMQSRTLYLTTTNGYPYTYHNGVAYFQSPAMNIHAQHLPAAPPPLIYPHPPHLVYQPGVYSEYQPFLQPAYTVYHQTEGMLPWISEKNQSFQHSQFNRRANFRRYNSHKDHHSLPYSPETAEGVLDSSQPLV